MVLRVAEQTGERMTEAANAASVLALWLVWLEAVRNGGAVCEMCGGSGRESTKFADGGYANLRCPACSGTGRLPPPDLIALCQQFADWLEDRGWYGWAVKVRPHHELDGNPQLMADRLLLLFRKPCKSCLGSGRMTDGRDRREPSYGHIIECDGCSGLGYLPLPPDKEER